MGYVDYVDASGVSLGGAAVTPPPGTIYIRRWSVEPLPPGSSAIVLQVLVTRTRPRVAIDEKGGASRPPDAARLVSVKTRKAS